MTLETDFESINNVIANLQAEEQLRDQQEALLNAEIAALRLRIARLKDERNDTRRKIRSAYVEKESVERKLQLEKESERIKAEIESTKAEIEELIKDAPWRNDAYDWQIEGAALLPERALLADKRGMGKTLSSIIWRRRHRIERLLVCLRAEVAYDFIKELRLREPNLFVYSMVSVTPDERDIAARLLSPFDEYVVVTNIESWRRDVDKTTEAILKLPYDGMILDEAHNAKNYSTGTAKGFLRLAEKIPKVLELTGTPIKNRPMEMFVLLHALYPDLFPTERKYIVDYCTRIGQNKWVFTEHGLVNLVKKISSFYLARSPEDVGRKVPPPRMIEYKLTLDNHPEQKAAYKLMTERQLMMMGGGDKVIPIMSQLAIMTRQAQMLSWPAGIVLKVRDPEDYEVILETIKFDVHQSVKADWAEEFIQELVSEGERVILFSRFKPAIYELKRRLDLAGLSVAVITGDENSDRKEIFDDFDLKTAPENPKFQVLLATYQTVGESANLNAARHMILYDRYWNPGNDDQAIGRIDRINSVDQATVHLPEVENTFDDFMVDLIKEKRDIVASFRSEAENQAKLTQHLRSTLK